MRMPLARQISWRPRAERDAGGSGERICQERGVLCVSADSEADVGIGDDGIHLKRRGTVIDRNDNRAGEPRGEICDRPFVAGGRHDGDGVSGLDSGTHQAFGERANLREILRGRHTVPGGIGARIRSRDVKGDMLRCSRRATHQKIGDVAVALQAHQRPC